MAAILKCDVLPASTITTDALSRYKYISMPTTQYTLLSVNFTIYISFAWHKEWPTVFFQPQKQFWFQTSSSAISDIRRNFRFITPPARRAWRSYKFASLRFSVLFSLSQVGLPLMGVTAVHGCLSHDF